MSALLPKYLKAVEAGQTIKFGRLGVSRGGLVYRKGVTPWEQIRSLDFTFDQGAKAVGGLVGTLRRANCSSRCPCAAATISN